MISWRLVIVRGPSSCFVVYFLKIVILISMYSMGLRMFTDEIRTLKEARDRVHVLVNRLKSCFLLLDGSDKNHVKMHDIVRDVAIYIASQEGHIVRNLSSTASRREESINCEWIWVVGDEINKLPISSSFPSLSLLKIDNYSAGVKVNTDPSFFQGMIKLNVLSFRSIPFRSLPETTQLLKYLQMLHLENCYSLKTISIVGELLSLEILICRSCLIAELPVEIGRLKKLRMLEVRHCVSLKRIAPEVISNLVQLEELIIVHSFDEWETKANGEQRKNAALCEIGHLENLTRLEIDIKNPTLTAEEIRFPSKIVKFSVTVGGREFSFDRLPYERKMRLSCKGDITFGKWIPVLLSSTEYLFAEGANNLDISQKMKRLILRDCSNVNKLVNITPSVDWSVGVFPLLESVTLYNLPKLEEICVGPIPKSSNFFGNLREIHLWRCSKLRKLFPPLITIDGLLKKLETLEIRNCQMMEQVFYEVDGEECQKITFSKLKSLALLGLSSLISFCKGSASIEFPLLQSINIRSCGQLKSLSSSTGYCGNLVDHDDSFHAFFDQKVTFDRLTEITISECNNTVCLFSSSIVKSLVNIKKLEIRDCKEMIKVIEDDEGMSCEKPLLLFPCLKELNLVRLPKLESFCKWICDLQQSSLERVAIDGCPLLAVFTMGNVTTANLKRININGKDKSLRDFNTVIKRHLNAEQ